MTYETLRPVAEAITDETLRANALRLLDKMEEKIEGIGDKEISWRPSTLRVIQAMSDTSSLPKGVGAGSLVVGEEVLPDEVGVVPLRLWKGRVMWNPDPDINQIVCQSPDAKMGYQYGECRSCPHAEFIEGKGADCNKTMNVIVISADLKDVFITSFAKSQYAEGIAWENAMKKAKTSSYKRTYTLSSKNHEKNKKVKTLFATPSSDRADESAQAFIDALALKVGEDRAAQLEAFYSAIERKNQKALPPAQQQHRIEVAQDNEGTLEVGQDDGSEYRI